MTPPFRIRRAGVEEAADVSAFAARTFFDTFGAANRPDDMAAYLAATFSPELQAAEIADPSTVVLVVDPSAQPAANGGTSPGYAGYAQLSAGPAPDAVTGGDPIELRRFYVASEWHGRGVAQLLMREVLGAAAARGARTLWLGVWERNPPAIAFYASQGFVRVGSHEFRLGTDLQTDLLLVRAVPPIHPGRD